MTPEFLKQIATRVFALACLCLMLACQKSGDAPLVQSDRAKGPSQPDVARSELQSESQSQKELKALQLAFNIELEFFQKEGNFKFVSADKLEPATAQKRLSNFRLVRRLDRELKTLTGRYDVIHFWDIGETISQSSSGASVYINLNSSPGRLALAMRNPIDKIEDLGIQTRFKARQITSSFGFKISIDQKYADPIGTWFAIEQIQKFAVHSVQNRSFLKRLKEIELSNIDLLRLENPMLSTKNSSGDQWAEKLYKMVEVEAQYFAIQKSLDQIFGAREERVIVERYVVNENSARNLQQVLELFRSEAKHPNNSIKEIKRVEFNRISNTAVWGLRFFRKPKQSWGLAPYSWHISVDEAFDLNAVKRLLEESRIGVVTCSDLIECKVL